MSPDRADPRLDDLIADITIDAYDHDEALIGFENAFDEANCFPCPGAVIDEDVEILSVAATNGRQELIATCQRRPPTPDSPTRDLTNPPAAASYACEARNT